jgi:hypothetical protein
MVECSVVRPSAQLYRWNNLLVSVAQACCAGRHPFGTLASGDGSHDAIRLRYRDGMWMSALEGSGVFSYNIWFFSPDGARLPVEIQKGGQAR